MKFLFAPDSFKRSMTSPELIAVLEKAAKAVFPGVKTIGIPVADGGEGTLDAIAFSGIGAERKQATVKDPLGRRVSASYLMLPGGVAVIEMAQASGLTLLSERERNPAAASSFGTGELIADALDAGARRLVLAIGGSATNDGGTGAMRALGVRFLDAQGREVPDGASMMHKISKIDVSNMHPAIGEARFEAMCDVTNPLLGPEGATYVYGGQKGASGPDFESLENGMRAYSNALRASFMNFDPDTPGAGAAGGMGAAILALLGGSLERGIDVLLELVDFDSLLAGVDLVITGEGRLDEQSARYGKAVSGIAARCLKRNIPVIAFCGAVAQGALNAFGGKLTSAASIAPGPVSLRAAIENAPELAYDAAERMFRLIKIGMEFKDRS